MRYFQEVRPLMEALPQWLSVAAALAGVAIAYSASRTWRDTLDNKRGDDLLAATYDFVGELGALRSAIDRRVTVLRYKEHVDRLFASRLTLQKAFVVAQRSYVLDIAYFFAMHDTVANMNDRFDRLHDEVGVPINAQFESAHLQYVNVQREADKFLNYIKSVVR